MENLRPKSVLALNVLLFSRVLKVLQLRVETNPVIKQCISTPQHGSLKRLWFNKLQHCITWLCCVTSIINLIKNALKQTNWK